MLFSAFVNNKNRRSEMTNCAQSHIKDVPGCSIIPAHVDYSPKAFANLSVAAFIRPVVGARDARNILASHYPQWVSIASMDFSMS